MAATKKKKAATTQSKTSARSGAKKTGSRTAQPQANAMRLEMTALFTVVAGILLAVFLYAPAGVLGGWLKSFFLGLLGIPAYLLPLLLIANGVHHGINKKYQENRYKYILTLVGICILSGIFHLFSLLPVMNPFVLSCLSDYYLNGGYGYGGGLIGGIITDVLRNMVGPIAAGVILFTVLIVLIMIITKWSPVKALLRVIICAARNVKEAKEQIQDEVLIRSQEVSPPSQPHRCAKAIPNFSDDEVTRSEKTPSDEIHAEDISKKPYEDESYIPESLRDIDVNISMDIDNIDEILEHALPDSGFSADDDWNNNLKKSAAVSTAYNNIEETPAEFHKIAQNTAPQIDWQTPTPAEENSIDDVDESAAEDEKIITKIEKVKGMEDVSSEIEEEIYEKIPYTYPDIDLLDDFSGAGDNSNSRNELKETAQKLIATLKSFNVEAKLLNVSKGPTVTRYELKPGDGVKVSKFVGLADDIALRLAASGIRIEAPIPNKEAIGIEIPNKTVDMVHIREVLDSDEFRNFPSKLAFALGKDITGRNVVFDIAKMPHVLIAGATGSGKSVCINTLITSLIYKADPNEVKLLMVDPKVVELGIYNGIPQLLIPVVTDPRRASGALYWAVQEMVRRYSMFAESNVRDIKGYNNMILESGKENTLPHIVIIIDELADLMMVAPNEVEDSICRLAQMARAAGMHLVIATQRPSVDVITGLIKANIPSRIAFSVSSQIDSRTILDSGGAEKLLGRGDMLFAPMGASKPTRLQGAFISDKEVERVVEFIKNGSKVKYDEDIIEKIENGKPININEPNGDAGDNDELLPRAIEIAVDSGKISASYLQRRLKVGFSRAARMIDQMEERGWIGPPEGSKPREVLISKEDYLEMSLQ